MRLEKVLHAPYSKAATRYCGGVGCHRNRFSLCPQPIWSATDVGKDAFVGKVTKTQVREIATAKLKDMNAANVESAMKSIAGTARSMGIQVVEG